MSGTSRHEQQVKRMEDPPPKWEAFCEGCVTSRYIANPAQGLWAYRVRACKVFACSGFTGAITVMHTSGEDCDDDGPLLTKPEDEAGDAVTLGPTCPIEP